MNPSPNPPLKLEISVFGYRASFQAEKTAGSATGFNFSLGRLVAKSTLLRLGLGVALIYGITDGVPSKTAGIIRGALAHPQVSADQLHGNSGCSTAGYDAFTFWPLPHAFRSSLHNTAEFAKCVVLGRSTPATPPQQASIERSQKVR